jgi:hypothetical protein
MKPLKIVMYAAILENVEHNPNAMKKHDEITGEILEPFRVCIESVFFCHAKNIDQAKLILIDEATKYFNELLEP